jgi:hypothetical protein
MDMPPWNDSNVPLHTTSMTISIHPARCGSEDILPGTWEGTKQDAVLATAQLREVWERKKSGEKAKYGYSEYDAQMANAQLRAFKLTKMIIRKARRNSLTEVPLIMEDMGFKDHVPLNPHHTYPARPAPPPTAPLPIPPRRLSKQKVTFRTNSSPKSKKTTPTSPIPESRFPPPPPLSPPRKTTNRFHQLPPVTVPPRKYSEELSPRSVPLSPGRPPRSNSPAPRNISPRPEVQPEPRRRTPEVPEKEVLPVLPFRRQPSPTKNLDPIDRCSTPMPEPKPRVPQRSPLRTSIYVEQKEEHTPTPPLNTKRRSLKRSVSFRFGEGLHNSTISRTSTLIYAELSDALKDLQRTIGAATVEVH